MALPQSDISFRRVQRRVEHGLARTREPVFQQHHRPELGYKRRNVGRAGHHAGVHEVCKLSQEGVSGEQFIRETLKEDRAPRSFGEGALKVISGNVFARELQRLSGIALGI